MEDITLDELNKLEEETAEENKKEAIETGAKTSLDFINLNA